jgi:WD40 repeat protein
VYRSAKITSYIRIAVQAMKLYDNLAEKDVIKFNVDGALNGSSCILVAWVPGSRGTEFVSVHRDGMIIKHHKIIGNSSDNALLHRSESQSSIRESSVRTIAAVQGGAVTCSALSPDGSMVAIATDNGVMNIVSISTGEILAGFPSFFGSFACCSWSPDGAYLAAGGEDDLIAVFRMSTKSIVAHCQGHTSWVSSVAIQPRQAKGNGSLNIVSVGQDLSMCTWEIPGIDALETVLYNSSVQYRDMNLIAPTSRTKIHKEPLSHVTFVDENHVVVSGYDGEIKYFARTVPVD